MLYRITEEECEAIKKAEKVTTNKRISQRLKVLIVGVQYILDKEKKRVEG